VDTRICDDQMEQSVVEQRLGKYLFSKQLRGRFCDNGEMNFSTQCPVFSTPSRYKTECIRE
jgi:hypothetical protein